MISHSRHVVSRDAGEQMSLWVRGMLVGGVGCVDTGCTSCAQLGGCDGCRALRRITVLK